MLNDRAQRLLKTLVERYIADGQPVGSRTLSRAAATSLALDIPFRSSVSNTSALRRAALYSLVTDATVACCCMRCWSGRGLHEEAERLMTESTTLLVT